VSGEVIWASTLNASYLINGVFILLTKFKRCILHRMMCRSCLCTKLKETRPSVVIPNYEQCFVTDDGIGSPFVCYRLDFKKVFTSLIVIYFNRNSSPV